MCVPFCIENRVRVELFFHADMRSNRAHADFFIEAVRAALVFRIDGQRDGAQALPPALAKGGEQKRCADAPLAGVRQDGELRYPAKVEKDLAVDHADQRLPFEREQPQARVEALLLRARDEILDGARGEVPIVRKGDVDRLAKTRLILADPERAHRHARRPSRLGRACSMSICIRWIWRISR